MKLLQDLIEKAFFNSRWLLAPLYIGLVGALILLLVKFGLMFTHAYHEMVGEVPTDPSKLVLAVLELVDVTLVASLVLIIIFSGYENFVSKIDCAEGHEDRPSWMGTIDYSGLKLKIIGSVVAISSIHLLANFMEVGHGERVVFPAKATAAAVSGDHGHAAETLSLVELAQRNLAKAEKPDDQLKAAQALREVTAAVSASENHRFTWKIALHMSFVFSGVLFALMEKISHSVHGSVAKKDGHAAAH